MSQRLMSSRRQRERARRHRPNETISGRTLKDETARQLKWVQDHGETLEGYYAFYKGINRANYDKARVQSIWEADTAYLNRLVTTSLMEHAGHAPDWSLLLSVNKQGAPK